MSEHFYQVEPTLENYWRALILFGRNVASYKFALAKSLYDLKASPNDLIRLEDLAKPFSKHLCEHLKGAPKQVISKSSKLFEACKRYNDGQLSQSDLIDATEKLGFVNVIDAFHVMNNGPISCKFFIDERTTSKGIRVTENFFKLTESEQYGNFILETESRWRLVETAWELGVSRNLIQVEYDRDLRLFFTNNRDIRVDITSSRGSLNGYQKGRCFYCYREITIESQNDSLAEVDHFFPWLIKDQIQTVNGVWNLVLACQECNRGQKGKFARVPSLTLLERLHARNEYFISSHHPLRETLMRQTGTTHRQRIAYLNKTNEIAVRNLIHTWEPEIKGIKVF